jgi:putative iron-regulated protein
MATFGFERRARVSAGFLLLLAGACGSDDKDEEPSADEAARAEVVAQYAAVVLANYEDVVETASALETAVSAFVKAPSEATHEAAKLAWLDAREPYGQCEVFRFYEGPIDSPVNDFEGLINGWPLGESHIDSVADDEEAGIINKKDTFPELTKELLIAQNGCCGADEISETNIATGYHAIEFLLWGQDLSLESSGTRPYTDFVVGEGATLPNGDRRGKYLALAAELLVEQLTAVRDAWRGGEGSYRAEFVAQEPDEALQKMLKGMTKLAGFELSGERMLAAWNSEDQENEHSCFSDNTHRDIFLNAKGVENAYRGAYGTVQGPSVEDLVKAADATLAADIDAHFAAAFASIDTIPEPFDAALKNAEGRAAIKASADKLDALHKKLLEITPLLGLSVLPDEDE